jgi:hypothetical protein
MRLVLAAAALALGACDLLLPIEGEPDSATTDASDAAPPEDVVMTDAPSDVTVADGAVNILVNPGFGNATVGCGSPWAAYDNSPSVTLAVADASLGSFPACQVCSTKKDFGIVQSVGFPDGGPSTFNVALSAWVGPAAPGAAPIVQMTADIHYGDGGRSFLNVPTLPLEFDAGTFISGNEPHDLAGELTTINFSAQIELDGGGCFLLAAPSMVILP